MSEVLITEIPLSNTNGLERDPEQIEGHAPFFWAGNMGWLVVRPRYCRAYDEGVVGEFSLSLASVDINCITMLWPTEFDEEGLIDFSVVGSVSSIVESLCNLVECDDDDDAEGHPSGVTDRANALAWADHLEVMAQVIRSRVGGAA